MTRPHICFIQAQGLPWGDSDVTSARPGVKAKTLSRDPASGASTQIVRYPAGFELPGGQSLSVAEELFVLDGELRIGELRYHTHCYAYLPASYRRESVVSTDGAVVLTMFTGQVNGSGSQLATDGSRGLVERLDPFKISWSGGAEGSVTGKPLSSGLATKILRRDAATGEQSFLYCSQPHHPPPTRVMPGKFTHPMVEEIFVLDGTFIFGDVGIMGPGGYCYWREDVWHGPVGSATGYHLFIRNLGGPLVNEFSAEPAPFSYSPAYQPHLPASLVPYAKAYKPPARW